MNKISFPFSPLIQDENQSTFCKMLDKSDSLVNLELTAVQIWCHWRAFITFPGTILVDSHFGQIKILECLINPDFGTLQDLQLQKKSDNLANENENENNNFEQNLQKNPTNLSNNDKNIRNKITKITQKNSWIQIKTAKQNLTFLICQDQTLLQITKIGLNGGKKIDFSGFSFD